MYFVATIILLIVLTIYQYKTNKLPFYEGVNRLSDRSILITIIFISVILSSVHIHEGHDWGGDYAEYISQALSILNKNMHMQVDDTSYMMLNSHIQHGPGAYPWGYPIIILPIIATLGVNFEAIKYVNAIFYVLLILAMWFLSEEYLSKYFRVILCGIMAFNLSFLVFLDEIYADIPFCLFSVLSIYYILKLFYEECSLKNSVFIGIMSFLASFVRSNGVVSILTLLTMDVLYLLMCRCVKKEDIVEKAGIKTQSMFQHSAAYVVFVFLYICTKCIFPMGDIGYSGYIGDISIRSIASNVVYYAGIMPSFWSIGRVFSIALSVLILFLGMYSMIHRIDKYVPILIYCVGMGALLIVFPGVAQGIRYVYPIIILALIPMLDTIQQTDCSKSKFAQFISIIPIAIIAMSMLVNARYIYEEYSFPDMHYSNYSQNEMCIDMYDFIRANTSADAIIISPKPRVIYLCTGRKGYSIGESNINFLSEADYALVDNDTQGTWYNTYIENRGFEMIYSNEQLTLYEIQ